MAIWSLPPGRYTITIEKVYRKRSNQQNRYKFGVAYKLIADGLTDATGEMWTVDKVHEFCKNNAKNQLDLLPVDYEDRIKDDWKNDPSNQLINKNTGEVLTKPFEPTTTKMTTVDEMNYHDNLKWFGAEWLGIDIPDPPGHKTY